MESEYFEPLDRECRVCGCTDDDCRGCMERTGERCHWVEPDLCSACAGQMAKPDIAVLVWKSDLDRVLELVDTFDWERQTSWERLKAIANTEEPNDRVQLLLEQSETIHRDAEHRG